MGRPRAIQPCHERGRALGELLEHLVQQRVAGGPPIAGRARLSVLVSHAPREVQIRERGGPQHQAELDCAVTRFFSVSYARRYSRAGRRDSGSVMIPSV